MSYKIVKLSEVLKLEYGKGLEDSDRDIEGIYPAYGANGVKARTNKFLWDKPSIIVGRKGSAGELTLTEGKFWALDVTYYVTHDSNKTDLMYLYYALQTKNLTSYARGVKPGINRNDIYALEIPLPPIETQRKLVKKLGLIFLELDKAIAVADNNVKNSEALFKSYLTELFEVGGKDWQTSPLGKVAKFIDYRGKTPTKTESGIRLITAKNVKFGFLNKEPYEFIAEDNYDTWMTRGIPVKGDVLFTTEAPLANVAQLDTNDKVVFAQRLIILQADKSLLENNFLKFALLSRGVQDEIISKGTGATVKGIKASLLKLIPICFPKLEEQRKICENLTAINLESERLKSSYLNKSFNLKLYKASILQQAFSGEPIKE